jgi:hypothetical protein
MSEQNGAFYLRRQGGNEGNNFFILKIIPIHGNVVILNFEKVISSGTCSVDTKQEKECALSFARRISQL